MGVVQEVDHLNREEAGNEGLTHLGCNLVGGHWTMCSKLSYVAICLLKYVTGYCSSNPTTCLESLTTHCQICIVLPYKYEIPPRWSLVLDNVCGIIPLGSIIDALN